MRVKVCGLSRAEDAKLAASLGAWALGFIFYERSPRAVSSERVREILGHLPPESASRLKTVGVFVNANLDEIVEAVRKSGINSVQLHGEETPAFSQDLKKALPGVHVIKAIRLQTPEQFDLISDFIEQGFEVLMDSFVPGSQGGTGVAADWKLAARARSLGPVILAGGLNPANIQQAIREVAPAAVDVSSGLETAPGVKSDQKMKEFFAKIAEMENGK